MSTVLTHSESFHADDVVVLDTMAGYRGFFALDTLHLKHRRFAGGWSEVFTRELFLRDPAAGVLLYDPDLDQVVLVEQFRVGALPAAQQNGSSPWLLELVAGIIAPGESAEELARREAVEEAGCKILALEHIVDYYNSPGGSNEWISLYCGRIDARGAGGIFGLEEEHEDIRVHVLSFEDAWQALKAGRMNNAMAIIALQWLWMNRDSLRQRWQQNGIAAT
ncbi:MAG: NUDIX domain-containing protein [Pseudomonadales bacterium]|nr:NUDIX domain-containing protein [Pseudomonadales bacterium]